MSAVSVADRDLEAPSTEPAVEAPIPTAGHFIKTVFRFGIAQAVSWVAGAALVVMLPRFLGDVYFGKLGFGFALTATYGLIADLGISFVITREVARAPSRAGEILSNAVAVRLGLGVIAVIAVATTLAVLHYDSTTWAICLVLSVSMVLLAVATSVRGTLQGLHHMQTVAVAPAVSNVAYAGGSAVALAANGGVVWVAAASALGVLAALAVNLTGLLGRVVLTVPSWRVAKYLVLGGFPFLVSQAALVIYGQIDMVLLSILTQDAVVGWYAAALRIMSLPQFVPSILTIVLFPALSAAVAKSDRYNQMLRRGLQVILLVNVPIAVGMGLLPDRAIQLLGYPTSFSHSIVPMVLLAAGIPLIAIDMVIGTAHLAGDRQGQWARVGVAAALLNPAMNLVAIPYSQRVLGNGAIGAAATTVLTEVFILIWGLKLLPAGTLDRGTYSYAVRCLVAAGAVAAVVVPLRESALVVPIVAGVVVYATASMALRTLTMSDIRLAFGHLVVRPARIPPQDR